ncbi:putative invertase inhibitor [Dendrobium catenatum]|uniref:putative invertase inhibitor n=1 Tax=Dendrobium catenatum TaxID=906689 RepID=UPI0009F185D6|nr:putative invertase inhibitor [Dendrobium catenatum]
MASDGGLAEVRASSDGLGVISHDIAGAKAANIQSIINKLLKSLPGVKKYGIGCLEDCLELYIDVVSQLKDSVEAIKAHHIDDARTWISIAVDAMLTCEDGLQEGGLKYPSKKQNDEYLKTILIPLDIAAVLDTK